ncbi:Solute carrier organic anion transporter family member 1C1 [Dirofilaria immitis]
MKPGSQIPCHLIRDAHEWINEIPTVPIYYLAKPQPRERACSISLIGISNQHQSPASGFDDPTTEATVPATKKNWKIDGNNKDLR